jgi:nitrate/nitrite transporter NarK
MWGICGQQFFRAAGYSFYTTWFPTYLQSTHAAGVAESGVLTSLPLVAVICGSLIGGMLSDAILIRTGSRRLARQVLAATCMAICALLIFAATELRDATWAVVVISVGSFCSAIGGPCAYTVTIDLGGKQIATVFGAMNMTGNFGAAVSPFAIAWLVEATGQWRIVLFAFAGVYAAATVCWLLLGRADSLAPDRGGDD